MHHAPAEDAAVLEWEEVFETDEGGRGYGYGVVSGRGHGQEIGGAFGYPQFIGGTEEGDDLHAESGGVAAGLEEEAGLGVGGCEAAVLHADEKTVGGVIGQFQPVGAMPIGPGVEAIPGGYARRDVALLEEKSAGGLVEHRVGEMPREALSVESGRCNRAESTRIHVSCLPLRMGGQDHAILFGQILASLRKCFAQDELYKSYRVYAFMVAAEARTLRVLAIHHEAALVAVGVTWEGTERTPVLIDLCAKVGKEADYIDFFKSLYVSSFHDDCF